MSNGTNDMLARPWWSQKTVITSAAGMVGAGAALIAAVFYSQEPAKAAAIIAFGAATSAFLGNLGSVFAAQRATAVGKVAVAADQKASVALGVPTEAAKGDGAEVVKT